jgi:hypothetical protein
LVITYFIPLMIPKTKRIVYKSNAKTAKPGSAKLCRDNVETAEAPGNSNSDSSLPFSAIPNGSSVLNQEVSPRLVIKKRARGTDGTELLRELTVTANAITTVPTTPSPGSVSDAPAVTLKKARTDESRETASSAPATEATAVPAPQAAGTLDPINNPAVLKAASKIKPSRPVCRKSCGNRPIKKEPGDYVHEVITVEGDDDSAEEVLTEKDDETVPARKRPRSAPQQAVAESASGARAGEPTEGAAASLLASAPVPPPSDQTPELRRGADILDAPRVGCFDWNQPSVVRVIVLRKDGKVVGYIVTGKMFGGRGMLTDPAQHLGIEGTMTYLNRLNRCTANGAMARNIPFVLEAFPTTDRPNERGDCCSHSKLCVSPKFQYLRAKFSGYEHCYTASPAMGSVNCWWWIRFAALLFSRLRWHANSCKTKTSPRRYLQNV